MHQIFACLDRLGGGLKSLLVGQGVQDQGFFGWVDIIKLRG